MNKNQLLLIICLILSIKSFAQNFDPCGYEHALAAREQQFPGYLDATRATFESAKVLGEKYAGSRGEVIKIPVVIHIVWKDSIENIPDQDVYDQIEVLNKAYRRLNEDADNVRDIFKPIVADAEIEFELAQIRRVKTNKTFQPTLTSFDAMDGVKLTAKGGDDAVDPEHFLNIWVCNILPINFLGQLSPLFGYAYPPAGLSHWPAGSAAKTKATDGVTIWYKAFGINKSINVQGFGVLDIKGKTTVHEVGHYLGLRHIWGDGQGGLLGGIDCKASDGVDDTPSAGTKSNFDCDTTKNTCKEAVNDKPDMVENYMDYSSDDCTNSFTKGQIAIMKGVLAKQRVGLTQSVVSVKDNLTENTVLKLSPNPVQTSLNISISAIHNTQNDEVVIYDLLGKTMMRQPLVTETTQIIDVSILEKGVYILKIGQNAGKFLKI